MDKRGKPFWVRGRGRGRGRNRMNPGARVQQHYSSEEAYNVSNGGKRGGGARGYYDRATRMYHWPPRMNLLDPIALQRREKQIDKGKATEGYQNYVKMIPRDARMANMPRTPSKDQECSRRSFDAQVKIWRRQLHVFDPPELKIRNEGGFSAGDAGSMPGHQDFTEDHDPFKMEICDNHEMQIDLEYNSGNDKLPPGELP